MKKQRSSNFELLRILAMGIIVFHHFGVHSGFYYPANEITVNRLWIQFISIGGKLGVNLFVLISGYFLINTQSLSVKKILKLMGQLVFYSVGIYVVTCSIGVETFSVANAVKSFLPITFQGWWFASTYFVMYLLSPFINVFLKNMTQQMYQKFLLIGFVMWCIVPTFINVPFQSNELLWFVYLYAVAAYIKLHGVWKFSAKRYLMLGCGAALLTFLSAVAFDILGTKIIEFGRNAMYFYGMQKLPIVVTSLLLFLGFEAMELGYVPWINKVASGAFGVYLIHDHVAMRGILWKEMFHGAEYMYDSHLALYSMGAVLLVYGVCTLIDLVRIATVEKVWMVLISKCEKFIGEKGGLKKRG